MSTLTRRSSGNRVPDYKDYMSFVSAYRNGKPESESNDEQNLILTNHSKKTAPEVSGFVCDSYSSFLEKTKTKKFSSVKPPVKTLNDPTPKPPVKVKTEIFLEINDVVEETPKKIEFTVTDNAENDNIAPGQVEARKKLFEGRTQQEEKPVTNSNKILTLKRKLESNIVKTTENAIQTKETNRINAIKLEPPNQITETKGLNTQINKTTEMTPKVIVSLPTQISMTDGAQDCLNFHVIEKKNNELQADISSKDRLIDQLNEKLKFKTPVTLETADKNEEIAENVCVKNVPKEFSSIPPPPPPMPNGFKQPFSTAKSCKLPNREDSREKNNTSPPFMATIRNQSHDPDLENSKKNNLKSSTLERTNPLVRKLAYGAMLDMYGAYHEKANSYVSTLPRQQVRKDNGLQKIIDSIAAQGGLDKLSGRSNPKAENE